MRNNKGFAEIAVLYVIVGILALFVLPPNPISNSLGVGIRPNKTVQVQTQTIEPIKDAQGNPIAYKTTTNSSEQDIQQHVTFWEWLRSLPILVLLLMGLGIIFPPVALFLHNAWSTLKTDTQKIVLSVDKGLAVLKAKDPALHQAVLNEMADTQAKPSSTELVVNKAQTGTL